MDIREYARFDMGEVLALYESAGWKNYTDHADKLPAAYEGSLCVLGAYEDNALVGIIRAVGDGTTIVFIQDIIVLPEHQRKGIGTALLKAVLEKYSSVYQIQLLTDDTEKTKAFYRSAGFYAASDMGCLSFVRMKM